MKKVSLVLAAALLAVPLVGAADDSVEATGAGTGRDKKSACEEGKKQAMRSAVEAKAGVYLAADSLAKDSMLVHDKIMTRADGFVSGVKILEEKAAPVMASSDFECTVKISATVSKGLGDEAKKIASAFAARGRPKVLLLIAEQSVGMTAPAGWWTKPGAQGGAAPTMKVTDLRQVENRFMSQLAKNDWRFVDPETIKGKISIMGPVSANPTDKELREFGKLSAAEVVIWGSAVAEEPSDSSKDIGVSGLMSAAGRISARAVATDSGEIYASYTGAKTAAGFNASKATQNVFDALTDMAAKDLERKIVDRWVSEAYGTMRIALVVNGVKDYATLARFKAQLSSGVAAVKEVNQRSFEGGKANFDLECESSADKLADTLAVASFQDYAITINKVTGNTLDVTLSPSVGGGAKKAPKNR